MIKKRKPHSVEARQNMSLAAMGKPGTRNGVVLSRETKQKMSLAAKGRDPWALRKTRHHSEETLAVVRGENSKHWIADRSKLAKSENRADDYAVRDWTKNVKIRDGSKCKISNDDCSGRLEVHHILGWKDYPELRYQINNGITLCHAHHPRGRAEEKRLSPYFQELVSVSKKPLSFT